ncbi:hypothetical protein [Ferrovibrio sp.]|uniref:hypothetical protein n=1 Tax=Ferrovibrio sp. TaxID=1917215 RepID=UPI002604804B|nr:hypothetical protein [Ferrovibrio sp.]
MKAEMGEYEHPLTVMAGLGPGIHEFIFYAFAIEAGIRRMAQAKDVDARHKAGHDADFFYPRLF